MAADGSIIVGREDEDSPDAFDDPAKLAANTDTIVAKIEELIGISLYPPHSRWATPFGNGITFSKIAAEIVKA